MAGSIFGLGMSQQNDSNGKPLSGCLLYIYAENTSTPAIAYSDFALSNALPHPIEGDGAGRIPAFWVADGSYRARLTSSDGDEIFDEPSITAIGASSGSGGGGSSVPAASIFNTGDVKWKPHHGTEDGWARCNGRTIGSVSSGATELAALTAEDLFLHLWNNFADAVCPVVGGRGANATADWAANKRITLFDFRDKTMVGFSGMGATSTGLFGDSEGTKGGAITDSVTVLKENLPAFNLSHTLTLSNHIHSDTFTLPDHVHSDTLAAPAHTHSFSDTTSSDGAHTHTYSRASDNNLNAEAGPQRDIGLETVNTSTSGAHTHTVSGVTGGASATALSGSVGNNTTNPAITGAVGNPTTSPAINGLVPLGGSGTALSISTVQPYFLGTFLIKL